MAKTSPNKIERQIQNAGLPTGGEVPFVPTMDKNRKGEDVIRKATAQTGRKKGKKGYVDTNGRIWIKDRAHGGYPDHWDVQVDAGKEYFRVDVNGTLLI